MEILPTITEIDWPVWQSCTQQYWSGRGWSYLQLLRPSKPRLYKKVSKGKPLKTGDNIRQNTSLAPIKLHLWEIWFPPKSRSKSVRLCINTWSIQHWAMCHIPHLKMPKINRIPPNCTTVLPRVHLLGTLQSAGMQVSVPVLNCKSNLVTLLLFLKVRTVIKAY